MKEINTALKSDGSFSDQVLETRSDQRARLVRRGRSLEYFTIIWNCLESIVAIGSGLVAGSIALVGFGFERNGEQHSFGEGWLLFLLNEVWLWIG